jgi:hypothetical protein
MTERCGSLKGIEEKLGQLADNTSAYIKSRETQDARWTVTREHGNKISVLNNRVDGLENKIEKLDCYLKSDDPIQPGVLKMIEIRLQRLENTITISNTAIKEELETFKAFIMKIIYSIGGGIATIIGIGGLITWVINILK